MVMMLDHPEKTPRLLAALKAAAPFEVELPPSLIDHLQAENVVNAGRMHQVVWDLSYAGDEGGIMCHMSRSEETGRALVVSLTYVRVPRSMPLAGAVAFMGAFPLKHLGSSSQIRPMLGSIPAPLLRASHEQPLATIQHELVLVRLPQHRPHLT